MFEGGHVGDRFHDIVPGAFADGPNGIGDDSRPRKHHHRNLRRLRGQRLNDLEAADSGHPEID